MGLKESTGVWGKTPLRWPLAVAGLAFFTVAGSFAVVDDDTRIMLYTCVVMGSTLIGAWIYALGHSRYTGESAETPSMLSDDTPEPTAMLDTSDPEATNRTQRE